MVAVIPQTVRIHVPAARTRRLALPLGLAVVAATVPTLVVDGILNGTPVMNGSARGTALVMLVLALPLLVFGVVAESMHPVRRRAVIVGSLAYVTYNSMLFMYATPFNSLFLVYAALMGTALWTLVSALLEPMPALSVSARLPTRGLAAFLFVVVALNALAWLGFVVPDLGNDRPAFLEGTGLTTNPIYVQDLTVWLPAISIVGVLLWRRRASGVQLAGAALVFWLVEAVGVAVDQWFGHRAAPSSDVATLSGSVMFVVMAAVTVVPLVWWWRTATDD